MEQHQQHQQHHHRYEMAEHHEMTEEEFLDLLQGLELKDDDKRIIAKILKSNNDIAKESNHLALTLLEKLETHEPKAKIFRGDVPEEIFDSDISAQLVDISVARNDDYIFKKDKWLHKNLPRGLAFLEITDGENEEKVFTDVVIHANRKFYNIEEESAVSIEPLDMATSIFCMEKLDGDAAHFTFRIFEGVFYVIGGSKNVHMIFKDYNDIDRYNHRRFTDAKIIAKRILKAFDMMEDKKLSILKKVLNATKMTVVCELLQQDNQHIVQLPNIQKEEKDGLLNFIMFCQTTIAGEIESLTALPPGLGISLAKAFGFLTPNSFIYEGNDFTKMCSKVRQMNRLEGSVFYFLKDDKTISLEKVKTVWHTMLITIRENLKFSKKKKIPIEDKMKIIREKLSNLQTKYKFNDKYRQSWEVLAEEFLKYLDENIKSLTTADVNETFPVTWYKFLIETNNTDEIFYEEVLE